MRRRTVLIVAASALALIAIVGGWALAMSTPKTTAPPAASQTDPTTTPSDAPLPPLPHLTLSHHTNYVALGDSFAAGLGGGNEKGVCQRSAASYSEDFASATGVRLVQNAGCSGATTTDLLANQLSALGPSANLVTVSIGGNDLNVAGLATACSATESRACQRSFQSSFTLLTSLRGRLVQTYAAIAQSAPNARIVVTGYPALFELPSASAPDLTSIAAVNAATEALNSVISSAVHEERVRGFPISYVSVSFNGHGIGSTDPWIHASGAAAYHPTAAGYHRYAEDLRTALA